MTAPKKSNADIKKKWLKVKASKDRAKLIPKTSTRKSGGEDDVVSNDSIRMWGTYIIAILVLVGAFVLLMFPSQVPSEQLIPFLTGFVGIVLGWAFNRESTTAGARASERSVAIGQASATPPAP